MTLGPAAPFPDRRRWPYRCSNGQRGVKPTKRGGGSLSERSLIGQRPATPLVILAFAVGWWPWYVGLGPEASLFAPSLPAIVSAMGLRTGYGLLRTGCP